MGRASVLVTGRWETAPGRRASDGRAGCGSRPAAPKPRAGSHFLKSKGANSRRQRRQVRNS